MISGLWRAAFFFLIIGFTRATLAETLVDADALRKMEGATNWQLVDARELSERSQSPIPGALEFDPELYVEGKILVVASDNATALLVAREIELRLQTVKVFVVDGGLETLRTIRPELRSLTGETGMPGIFTIPSDTCEPGDPLHTFADEDEN